MSVRGVGMETNEPSKLEQALFHLKNAIRLLDDADAPPEIASHLDMGLHMLERRLTGNLSRDNGDRNSG